MIYNQLKYKSNMFKLKAAEMAIEPVECFADSAQADEMIRRTRTDADINMFSGIDWTTQENNVMELPSVEPVTKALWKS